MQRFLIPIISLAVISGGICAYMLFFTAPQSDTWVLLFLSNIFVLLEIILGVTLHMLRCHQLPNWPDKRDILRESLKLTCIPSLAICSVLLLRYFVIDSPFNLGALILAAGSLEVYITYKT